ncbi:hypothetical protein SAMN05421847_0630 [Halpernia humi]|uniref:Uncharacterized protein n=1 Tax=Halpernia humi TaxID=493375 RepID=A0A1H5U0D2_9FLAO|nr:hypothetical protein [Halpernia humi]SEF68506.1 hypothetical protein SAMN05421847_0630 [Halpernia humi]
MENSSKQNMEEIFTLLSQIKKVEPDEKLFANTLEKIHQKNTVSMFWVSAVACGILLLISTEFFMVLNKNNMNTYSKMIPETNNILYHE